MIDLHIHSKASDGKFSIEQIISEAKSRKISFMSITDHDDIHIQTQAVEQAKQAGLAYVTGVELNVTFSCSELLNGKAVSLDFLGYQYDPKNQTLSAKLKTMAEYREKRATKILEHLNSEFTKENISPLTKADFQLIQKSVDGTLGRPHIADYLVKKGIVTSRQEAFDKYLVKCNVPKYPLHLADASKLIHDAGGKLVLAHPNDPHGTSLVAFSKVLDEQSQIIDEYLLPYIDGVECWHSRASPETIQFYVAFAKQKQLMITGGSDCHQKPVIMGTVDVPAWVKEQFTKLKSEL